MPDLTISCAPILDLPRSAEIVIAGGVNATNAALLKDRITASLDRRTAYVSILMKNVSYVNSSGFGYFMDLAGMLERRGGSLVLVEVQPKVKVVFNNLGMQNFFRFELSDENARAFLRGQAEKVARCTAARKLLHIAYAVVTTQTAFDPEFGRLAPAA